MNCAPSCFFPLAYLFLLFISKIIPHGSHITTNRGVDNSLVISSNMVPLGSPPYMGGGGCFKKLLQSDQQHICITQFAAGLVLHYQIIEFLNEMAVLIALK